MRLQMSGCSARVEKDCTTDQDTGLANPGNEWTGVRLGPLV